MLKRSLVLLVLVCILFSNVNAQSNKYWIFFKDKDTSNYDCSKTLSKQAIQNRKDHGILLSQFSDVSLKQSYINTLSTSVGVDVVCKSKWLICFHDTFSKRRS